MKNKRFSWKYAIGEVLIVSIGILIAFSVNTYSSKWKKANARKEYKVSLIADLKQNLKNLKRIIKAQELKVKELTGVVESIEELNYNTDSLGRVLFRQRKSPTFYPINGTFKSLVSQGDIELFDTQIKRELFNLYDTNYERVVYNGILYDEVYVKVYDPEIRDLIDFRSKKIDKPSRLNSKEFLKNIMFVIDEADSYLKLIRKCAIDSEKMLTLINEN